MIQFIILTALSFNLIFPLNQTEDKFSIQNKEPSHCFDESNIRTITRCRVDTNTCGQRYAGEFYP